MKELTQIERKEKGRTKENNNGPIFCYITFYDHYKNANPLTDEQITEDLKNPVILKRFGTIQQESNEYIVLKGLIPEEYYFIYKSCIKEKIIYEPKRRGTN